MNSTWQDFLRTAGGRIENQQLADFGQPQQEYMAALNDSILTDLSHLHVTQFAGEDSEGFLQGQVSCDVKQATLDQAQFGSYCTPKGRMLATFLLWRGEEGFFMQLPAELRESVSKRLSMYVMRSKVKLSDASEQSIRLGIAGDAAPAALSELGSAVPQDDYAIARSAQATVIRLPGGRFELMVSPENAAAAWQTLARHCTPVGSDRWSWLEIQAGIPMVTSRTQEQFVPQMANLELIGGVNFKKGCYPGQEIVARSQYLGKVKRRMYRAHIKSEIAPQPGELLFGDGPSEQSGGMIVNAQSAPGGGFDVLAVILNASIESGAVHWNRPDGEVLKLQTLPYAVE